MQLQLVNIARENMDWRKINRVSYILYMYESTHWETRNGKVVKRTTWNSRRIDQQFNSLFVYSQHI